MTRDRSRVSGPADRRGSRICNFNDSANVQGNGTTIETLHPVPGSMPTRMVQDPNLKGCAALAVASDDAPWAAAYSSNLAPFYGPTGALVSTLSAGPWAGPWGEISPPPSVRRARPRT